jgi:hypothetical protein
MPPAGAFARLHKRELGFGYLEAVSGPVALSAPAAPVPTASTKQKHNQDDNQDRFDTHFEILL